MEIIFYTYTSACQTVLCYSTYHVTIIFKTNPILAPTSSQVVEPGQRGLHPLYTIHDLLHIAGELLSKGEWGGILGVRPTDLYDVLELISLREVAFSWLVILICHTSMTIYGVRWKCMPCNLLLHVYDYRVIVFIMYSVVSLIKWLDWLVGQGWLSRWLTCQLRLSGPWLTDWMEWLTDTGSDWLFDWLFVWLTDWMKWMSNTGRGWRTVEQFIWLTEWLTEWMTDTGSGWLTDWNWTFWYTMF